MKKSLLLIVFCLTVLFSHAQSSELKAALEQVNRTLKEFAIGTEELRPNSLKGDFVHGEFKVIRFSYDYPNLIFDYTVVTVGGWSSSIDDGVYSVIIPINSIIEYPGRINSFSGSISPQTSNRNVSFHNENGLTHKADGKASIITDFFIIADSELTAKKFASELIQLKKLLVSEGYQGKLGGSNPKKSTRSSSNNGSKTSSNQTSTPKKVGKYVQ